MTLETKLDRLSKLQICLFVGAVALAIRIVFVYQWFQTPYAGSPLLDAASYDSWAKEILEGQWLRNTAFYQSPLYPYLLAALYKITGPNLSVVAYFQALLSAATCSWLALIAFETFGGATVASAAGLLAAFYRPMIFFTAPAMKETLSLFLLTGSFYFLTQSLIKRRHFLISGIFLGLTALTRGNALFLAPVFLLLLCWDSRHDRWKSIMKPVSLFAIGLALTILPATIHNAIVSKDFVLLNYTGGYNFYIGNSPSATGSNHYPQGISSDPAEEEKDVTRIAELEARRSLRPSEISDYWMKKGLRFAIDNPVHTMVNVINKLALLTNNFEQPDNYDIGFFSREMPTLLSLPLINFGLLFVFAAAGFVIQRKNKRARIHLLFAGTYVLSIIGFYITDRYRLPLIVFFFPTAASALCALLDLRALQKKPAVIGTVAIAAVITFFPIAAPSDSSTAFNWGVLAGIESEQGHDHEAVADFAKAKAIDANGPDIDAVIKTSTSFERLGDLTQAAKILEDAMKLHPEDSLAPYNLARLKLSHSGSYSGSHSGSSADLEQAKELFATAQRLAPWRPLPYLGLGVTEMSLGHIQEAQAFAKRGLEFDPQSPELRKLLSQIETRLGTVHQDK